MPHLDPEARRRYFREWKIRNKAQVDARRPDDDRARHANRRAALYGAPGKVGIADIRAVLTPDATCVYCDTDERLTIDHIVPLNQRGPNTRENLQPCCLACNISKWRSERPGRWSRSYGEACSACGTTERKHVARGLCNACYLRRRPA